MNNNLNKMKQFFKKEGFYVILFVCLCAVATVAAITAGRNNSKNTDKNDDVAIVEQTNKENVVNKPENPGNALQVKEELGDVPVVENNGETAPVSNSSNMTFENPVIGTLGRAYAEDPVLFKTTNTYKTHLAMDIKAEEGAAVSAVGAGVVKKVGVDTEGNYVEIDHQNGLTTIYGNLQDQVAVKEGDAVTAGQQIGTIGNTTNLAYEEYGTYLHFQVMKDGVAVDPAKYVTYEK